MTNHLQGPNGDVHSASERTLIYFASYLTRTVRHSAVKLYLAAVRNLYITAGYNDPYWTLFGPPENKHTAGSSLASRNKKGEYLHLQTPSTLCPQNTGWKKIHFLEAVAKV